MDLIEFQKVSIAEARQALDTGHRRVHAPIVAPARRVEDPGVLLGSTVRWIARLPERVRPLGLALKFPRVANTLGDVWDKSDRCAEYLKALVADRRGDRFPADVATELARLSAYHTELNKPQLYGLELVALN